MRNAAYPLSSPRRRGSRDDTEREADMSKLYTEAFLPEK